MRLKCPKISLLFLVLIAVLSPLKGQDLQRLTDCQLVKTDWADGDSFQIRTATAEEHTIRLYGVDCIEAQVNDDSDARRLGEQRRYFGISTAGGSAKDSIEIAKQAAKLAAEETAKALARPFTVHTAFADARGDGKHKRIYAFVTTAEGEDLGERLVRMGHARAFGVYRETPDGNPKDSYREKLRDIELGAAKLGNGIWAKTDWTKLADERQVQRVESTEIQLAVGGRKTGPAVPLDPNTAARDELMQIPGIGEVMANRIIEGRPYQKISDLGKVTGIGPKMMAELRKFLRLGSKTE